MSTSTMLSQSHLATRSDTSLLSSIALRMGELRTAMRRRSAAHRLWNKLQALDDRMLLDIGLDETDIARLRSGERFVPMLVQH